MRRNHFVGATIASLIGLAASGLAAAAPAGDAAAPRDRLPLAGVMNPDWVAKPTGEDLTKEYPPLAALLKLEGFATMECTVAADGVLGGCSILRESPVGMGFGEAALDMAALFKMRPQTVNGVPVGGASVVIPLRFALPAEGVSPPRPVEITDPRRLALARALVLVAGAQTSYKTQIGAYVERALEAKGPPQTPEGGIAQQELREAIDTASAEFAEMSAEGYAAAFSRQNLMAMITFYRSPAGKAWVAYNAAPDAQRREASQFAYRELTEQARKAFCAKVACYTPPPKR